MDEALFMPVQIVLRLVGTNFSGSCRHMTITGHGFVQVLKVATR